MKVALTIERADIEAGGAERSVFELATALRSADCQVDIIAAKVDTESEHVISLCQKNPNKRTPYRVFENALKEYLAHNEYDIIHSTLPFDFADVYQPRGGSYPEAVIRNAASYENGFVQFLKKHTAFLNFRRAVLANAERHICESPRPPLVAALSDYVARQFKEHYGLGDEHVIAVRNGVLIDSDVEQTLVSKLRLRIMTGLEIDEYESPVFFLFAAHNFRLKGLGPLIKAMQMAASDSEHSAYLIVAGAGNPAAYMRLAKRLNVSEKILFLGPVRNIRAALAACGAAVLPTYYDPSSRFILEALAADKPVITTKYNGATDLFTNNRHGRVIDVPENIPALAGAIGYFTNEDNINKAATAIIKDDLRQQISLARAAQELRSVYESIVARKGK